MKTGIVIALMLASSGLAFAKDTVQLTKTGRVKTCVLISKTLCEAIHDRLVMIFAGVHTTSLILDGAYTVRNVRKGYVETDPISRVLIGRHPTWNRMAPIGAAWIIAELYVTERMRHSHNRIVRKCAFVPQILGIASNGIGAEYGATH